MSKCPYKDCWLWEQGRKKDECDNCVDGRDIELVSEYASTCDGCGELTSHVEIVMDNETQLGYCEECAKKMNLQDIDWET
jgi:hypothetical protein